VIVRRATAFIDMLGMGCWMILILLIAVVQRRRVRQRVEYLVMRRVD
jgi:hypothetical protein